MMDDFWAPSVKLLSDFKFLDKLKGYDKDNIAPATMKKIRATYVTNSLSLSSSGALDDLSLADMPHLVLLYTLTIW